jgi:hypothetical protein
MDKKMIPKIAICLISYDRLDCTLINQEIFKLNFSHPYIVVHASSGAKASRYLEDAFVQCKPLPHVDGAISLMRKAIKEALPFEPDFLVVLDGDTWLLEEKHLLNAIQCLNEDPTLLMATCAWMNLPRFRVVRLALELADIVRIPVNRRQRFMSLPQRITYDATDFCTQFFILRNYQPLINLFFNMPIDNHRLVERQWFDHFSAHFNLERVLRMREREPVHPEHRFVCEQIGLHSEHWPMAGTYENPPKKNKHYFIRPDTPGKREALERYTHIRKGESIQRLLKTTDPDELAYYNAGAKRY